ncbi:12755_t:CDS:1, partial [Gigaspora margarita]
MSSNKKIVHHSSLSEKIKNLLLSEGLNVKDLNKSSKYSTIEVSFGQKFFRNLFIWNKKISNENDYLDLYKITSKFTKGEWLIVGNSLMHDNGEDLWEQFQEKTHKSLNKNMAFRY